MSQTVTFTLDGANLYSAFRGARVTRILTNGTIAKNGGVAFFQWDTVDRDTGSNSWVSATPSRLICNDIGNVIIRAGITWQHGGNGQGIAVIKKNGVAIPGSGQWTQDFSAAGQASFTLTTGTIAVAMGDYFELEITNTCTTTVITVPQNNPSTWFELQYAEGVRGPVGVAGPVGPAGQIDLSTRVQTAGTGLMNAGDTAMCTYYSQAYIMQDGTVKTSGAPRNGSLGSGNYENNQVRPVPLAFDNQNIGPITSVIMNYHGGHLLTATGDVWGWGYNLVGQVGDGSYTTKYVPVPVIWNTSGPKPTIVKLVCTTKEDINSPYYDYVAWYALDNAGNIWAWGYNGFGQIIMTPPNTQNQDRPIRLTTISNVVDIEATGGYMGGIFAIKSDGTVWSAGYNFIGILGCGGGNKNIWTKVNLPSGVPCIKVRSTGMYHVNGNGYGHTLFLLADGRVFASGYNGYGQIGNNNLGTEVNGDPAYISTIDNIVNIWVGGALWGHSFAARSTGEFYAWGNNGYGQLGLGISPGNVPYPQLNPFVTNVKSVKIGGWGSYNHSLVLTNSGQVYSAGNNDSGQLGMGIYGQQPFSPKLPYAHNLVLLPPGIQGNIVQIGVSGYHNVAASQMLDSDGHVWTCGSNGGHQLAANPSFGAVHSMPTRVMF